MSSGSTTTPGQGRRAVRGREVTGPGAGPVAAWVADITGLLDLDGWPAGMRVIVRKERPHPGAQLPFTEIDGC
jgi:hypothetical protein